MLRTEALRVLGLAENHDENDLRRAYASAVRLAHPDTGGDRTAHDVDRLKKAKDVLAARFAEDNGEACVPCKGKGTIMGISKFGSTCKACGGTGRAKRAV